jgi:hypothetical protein
MRKGDSFLHEVSNTALMYFSSHHTTRRAIVFDLFFISEAGFFICPFLLLSSEETECQKREFLNENQFTFAFNWNGCAGA